MLISVSVPFRTFVPVSEKIFPAISPELLPVVSTKIFPSATAGMFPRLQYRQSHFLAIPTKIFPALPQGCFLSCSTRHFARIPDYETDNLTKKKPTSLLL